MRWYNGISLEIQPREVAIPMFTRITVRSDQMGGVPCIRGLRIPVATVVGMMGDGMTEREILDSYPDLNQADIREALQYAAEALRERELPLVSGARDFSSITLCPRP
jgi:uncharacterized protein (DUF433 family)